MVLNQISLILNILKQLTNFNFRTRSFCISFYSFPRTSFIKLISFSDNVIIPSRLALINAMHFNIFILFSFFIIFYITVLILFHIPCTIFFGTHREGKETPEGSCHFWLKNPEVVDCLSIFRGYEVGTRWVHNNNIIINIYQSILSIVYPLYPRYPPI